MRLLLENGVNIPGEQLTNRAQRRMLRSRMPGAVVEHDLVYAHEGATADKPREFDGGHPVIDREARQNSVGSSREVLRQALRCELDDRNRGRGSVRALIELGGDSFVLEVARGSFVST